MLLEMTFLNFLIGKYCHSLVTVLRDFGWEKQTIVASRAEQNLGQCAEVFLTGWMLSFFIYIFKQVHQEACPDPSV